MLGNKLFIVCEYMPYSLLQLLEGAAEPPGPSSSYPLSGWLLRQCKRYRNHAHAACCRNMQDRAHNNADQIACLWCSVTRACRTLLQ